MKKSIRTHRNFNFTNTNRIENCGGGKKGRGGCSAFEWNGKPDVAKTVKFQKTNV